MPDPLGRPAAARARSEVPGFISTPPLAEPGAPAGQRGTDASLPGVTCDLDLHIQWHVDLEAAAYATPVVAHLYPHSKCKQLVVPNYLTYIDLLDGDGAVPYGWPVASGNSIFQSSPLVLDIDGDGAEDVCLCDADGIVRFYSVVDGVRHLTHHAFGVPSVGVRAHWWEQHAKASADISSHVKFLQPVTLSHKSHDVRRSDGVGVYHHKIEHVGKKNESESGVGASDGARTNAGANSEWQKQGWEDLLDEETGDDEDEDAEPGLSTEQPSPDGFVIVDAHVLTTPLLYDVDADGAVDITLAVSYFFDGAGSGVEHAEKYAVAALASWNFSARRWHWTKALGLTVNEGDRRAQIYSAPTAADIDGDGSHEILVGMSTGEIHVVDAVSGTSRQGFPVRMEGEIQGHVAVADVHSDVDGHLEIIVADMRGNVICLDHKGTKLWSRHVKASFSQGPSIVDLNDDGNLDVVVPDKGGVIWALDGATGSLVPRFPVSTPGRILAPVTVAHMKSHGQVGPHLVFPSFDGHLYVYGGASGCVSKVDLGEHAYAGVLASDVDGDGALELVMSTMTGTVFAVATNSPVSRLGGWTSERIGPNRFTHRPGHLGVRIVSPSGTPGHMPRLQGDSMQVQYSIIDQRRWPAQKHYRVCLQPCQSSICCASHSSPGTYSMLLQPGRAGFLTVRAQMHTEHGLIFTDAVPVTLDMDRTSALAWCIVFPLLISLIVFGTIRVPQRAKALPVRGSQQR